MKLLLTFLISFSASAAGFQDALKECVQEKDWEKAECVTYSEAPEDKYHQGDFEVYIDDPFNRAVYAGLALLHEAAYDGLSAVCPGLHSESVANGEAILRAIVPQLKSVKEKKKLSACRSACLVKCASSKLMKFEAGKGKKFTSLEDAVGSGKGECTEFTKLAVYLGEKLGVKTRFAGSSSHAFVEFEIDGKWMKAEPQNQSCVFW